VSYINLAKRIVERTYDVSTDAIDIVLPGNGHVYVWPRTDQWATVRNVDLKTGGESPHEGRPIYAGMLARLHPSAKYIYGADNGLSPSDIHKFSILTETIKYLGDSRYHGDYTMGGNLWFSEDGARIFVKGGNVFRSSEAPSQDILYAGALEGVFGLRWVATSTKAKKVLALDGGAYTHPQAPGLRVYDTDFLSFKGTVALPKFTAPKGPSERTEFESQGYYVFVNSDTNRVYVLLNADPASGIDKDWALATFDLSKMP
jgi:chitinase